MSVHHNNMSILVLSFDAYSDIWEAFFETKKKYWKECSYKTRLVSNYEIYPEVDTICVGKETCWSERTLKALEHVKEPYVMLLLEDYLFASDVDESSIDQALDYMIENDAKYMRIVTIPVSRHKSIDDTPYVPIYENEEYGVNLQASIWRVDYLRESVKNFCGSPWDFEVGFLSKAMTAESIPMSGCYAVKTDLINIKNGVLKGKWFPSVLKFYSRKGMNFNWARRGRLSVYEELSYNVRVGLKNILDYRVRRIVKKALMLFGVKFVSKL